MACTHSGVERSGQFHWWMGRCDAQGCRRVRTPTPCKQCCTTHTKLPPRPHMQHCIAHQHTAMCSLLPSLHTHPTSKATYLPLPSMAMPVGWAPTFGTVASSSYSLLAFTAILATEPPGAVEQATQRWWSLPTARPLEPVHSNTQNDMVRAWQVSTAAQACRLSVREENHVCKQLVG